MTAAFLDFEPEGEPVDFEGMGLLDQRSLSYIPAELLADQVTPKVKETQ